MILLSLQIQAQRPYNATFVIIRDSLCMKNGGGDSCVTVIMNDTLVNTTWVRNLILAYDSILHAQYADSAKYADSSGFADTSYFSLNVGAGGSPGDVQYNNAGVLDGAPMTTDGSDIAVTNDMSIGIGLDIGFQLSNVVSIPSVLNHSFILNPLSTYPMSYSYSNTTSSMLFRLANGYFQYYTSTPGGTSYIKLNQTQSPYFRTRVISGVSTSDIWAGSIANYHSTVTLRTFVNTDSLLSEILRVDTGKVYIEIDGDIDNPDPQYNFEKDSMWITTKLVQPQVFLQFYNSSPLTEPILSADTYQTIEGMSISSYNELTYTDSSVTVPAKEYGLYSLHYSLSVSSGTNNTKVSTAIFKNDILIPSTERTFDIVSQNKNRELSATVGEILFPGDVLKLKIEADLTATLTIDHIGIYLKRE